MPYLNKVSAIKKDLESIILKVQFKYTILFLIIPVLCFILMLFPSNIQELLKLNINNPSWWQFLTRAFIHKDWTHFTSNIGMYLILSIVALIMTNFHNQTKKFLNLLFLTSIILPIITSILTTWLYPSLIPMIKTTAGLSGIVAAMAGFIGIFWLAGLQLNVKRKILTQQALNILLFYVALIFVIRYQFIHQTKWLIIIVILLLTGSIYLYKSNFQEVIRGMSEYHNKNQIIYFLSVFSIILFLCIPFLIFPLQIAQENSLVDFFIHYFGLLWGLITSYYCFR